MGVGSRDTYPLPTQEDLEIMLLRKLLTTVLGGGTPFTPLLFDRFLTDRSAGAINGTAAEPGGSLALTRTVSDTGSKATIAADEFKVASGAGSNTPVLVYGPISRVTGQALAAKVHIPDNGNVLFGWSSTSNGLTQTAQMYGNLWELKTADNFARLAVLTQDGPTWLVIVQRATGYFYFAFGGANLPRMTLIHVSRSGTTASLYASLVHVGSAVHLAASDVLVSSDLYTPTALASGVSVSGTLNLAESGKTNHITVAGLTRAAANIGVVTRYADANNYVIVYHNGTNVKVDKVVAGVTTNVANVAKTYSAGADLEVIWKDTLVRVLYNNSALNAAGYTISDAGLQTGTQVGVYSTDAGNSVANFECFALGTSGEHAALKTAVVRQQSKPLVICDGDSLTAGDGVTQTQTYPYQLADALGRDNYDLYNFGVGGQTIANMLADYDTQIVPHGATWSNKTVIVWGGTNDLNAGASAETVYANLASDVNGLLAAGFDVIVVTMVKRGTSPTLETKRTTYNGYITGTAGWTVYDAGALAQLQDVTNLTYYQADQIHLTATSYGIIAAGLAGLI